MIEMMQKTKNLSLYLGAFRYCFGQWGAFQLKRLRTTDLHHPVVSYAESEVISHAYLM